MLVAPTLMQGKLPTGRESRLMTYGAGAYKEVGRELESHESVHQRKQGISSSAKSLGSERPTA